LAKVVDIEETETLELRNNLLELSRVLRIADENGLFCRRNPKKLPEFEYKDIFELIHNGINVLSSNKADRREVARKNYEIAFHQIYNTIDNTRWSWRFTYVFGGPIFLYFGAVSVAILLLWFFYSPVIIGTELLWIPFWAYLWGMVGGVFQGVWSLWHQLESQSLRRHRITWYYLLPFMGAILGAIAYLVFFAGFIVSTGANTIASVDFVMLLSALAGFSSKWAVELMVRVTQLIQPQRSEG